MPERVFIPFDLPVYRGLNSNHPLLACLVEQQYDGISLQRAKPSAFTGSARVMESAAELSSEVSTVLDSRVADPDAQRDIAAFVCSRDLVSQTQVPADVDLAFYHTAPLHINQTNWFLHIESISQIFYPFLSQGKLPPQPLQHLPVFWCIRALLESDRCKAIFSNLEFTVDQLATVFRSEIINAKTSHIAAGPWFTPVQEEIVQSGLAERQQRDEVKILFTNSWHDDPLNFILRGGIELVVAFLAIAPECPNLTLVMRTSVPEMFRGTELEQTMRTHPRITLISDRMSDDQMVQLFADADIFALYAAALHSVSLLRAMHCASACIVSDAPGYSEYIDDGVHGLVLSGRREQINRMDEGSGWVMDDYSGLFAAPVDEQRITKMASSLRRLYDSAALRRSLGAEARRRALTSNSFTVWRSGFERIMRSSLEKSVISSSAEMYDPVVR